MILFILTLITALKIQLRLIYEMCFIVKMFYESLNDSSIIKEECQHQNYLSKLLTPYVYAFSK